METKYKCLTDAERTLLEAALDPEGEDDLRTARVDVLRERLPKDFDELFIEAYKPTLIARAKLAEFYRKYGLNAIDMDKSELRRRAAIELGLPEDAGEGGSWFKKGGKLITEEAFQRMREAAERLSR